MSTTQLTETSSERCPLCGGWKSDHTEDTTVRCGSCGKSHVFWEVTPTELKGSTFECVDCGADNIVPSPGVGQ